MKTLLIVALILIHYPTPAGKGSYICTPAGAGKASVCHKRAWIK